MAWDFSTDPAYQEKLDWAAAFVRAEVEPLDLVYPQQQLHTPSPELKQLLAPLKAAVREQGLWATHLGPELGGRGFGQLELALLNEVLGRSFWAPTVFGTQAPDTGNAEILAHYGTADQQARFLQPLLDGENFSCYSMTEPQGGSDPGEFRTTATRDGDGWILDGWKFFSSNAANAAFFIVLAVTHPDAPLSQRMSMFLVEAGSPGVDIVRNLGLGGDHEDEGNHALIHYNSVRLPADALLGEAGRGFAVAQTRLGGGRVHHAMRTVGLCQRALDMLCERAVSRHTKGSPLADKQLVQSDVAECWIEIQQLRLLVLHTAWLIDQRTTDGVRREIAAIKVMAPKVLQDVVTKSIEMHGALGISSELPLWDWLRQVYVVHFSDGPSPIHRMAIGRDVLRDYPPTAGLWPTEHLPTRVAAARRHLDERASTLVGT